MTRTPVSSLPVPTTLPEFTRLFPNEAACVAYLYRARWPDGFERDKRGGA